MPQFVIEREMPGVGGASPQDLKAASQTSCNVLPDLGPVRDALAARGIRRAYASYGPAFRLTFESGERIVASQPWNERFLHFPLPYLDEVRFATSVAWILTPAIPTDMPGPRVFEDQLGAAGGSWRRTDAIRSGSTSASTTPAPSARTPRTSPHGSTIMLWPQVRRPFSCRPPCAGASM